MKTLMEKKKIMKLFMTALVGVVAVYGGAMLYSASAMISREVTVEIWECPKCKNISESCYGPTDARIFTCQHCKASLLSAEPLCCEQRIQSLTKIGCTTCNYSELHWFIEGETMCLPKCPNCKKSMEFKS